MAALLAVDDVDELVDEPLDSVELLDELDESDEPEPVEPPVSLPELLVEPLSVPLFDEPLLFVVDLLSLR